MKIINEELLIDQSKVSELNKKRGKDWINSAIMILKELYSTDYDKYINTNNKASNKLDELLVYINRHGWDTSDNKALELIDALIKNNKSLTRDAYVLGSQLLLENKELNIVSSNWLLDLNSYEPLFKAKALAFLNMPKALAFGDKPKEAANVIKELNDLGEIETFLRNWQTKSGEGYGREITILAQIMKYPMEFFKDASIKEAREFFKYYKKSDDLLSDKGKEVVRGLLTSIVTEKGVFEDYKDIIKELTEKTFTNKWWEKLYNQLKRELTNSSSEETTAETKTYLFNLLDDILEEAEKRGAGTTTATSTTSTSSLISTSPAMSGLKILESSIPNSIEEGEEYNELRKYIKKLDLYRLTPNKAAIDDYFGTGENCRKILSKRYANRNDFDYKLNNLIRKISK